MRLRPIRLALLSLMFSGFGTHVLGQAMSVDARTRAELTAIISAEDAAWNRGDAESFTQRALPDVVFTNIVGYFSVGKAPFLAQHQRIFSTIYRGTTNHQAIQHITLVKADVAVVDTLAMVSGVQTPPPGVQLIDGAVQARLEQVMVRQADGWHVAAFHNVAVSPAFANRSPPKP